MCLFFFKQKTAYEMRISDWSSDVCSSDLLKQTTEGGLDAAGQFEQLAPIVSTLSTAGIRVSLFIEPDPAQIDAAIRLKAPVVEFHTGRYAHLDGAERSAELRRLSDAAALAAKNGIEPHAGHGLTFDNVGPDRKSTRLNSSH